MLFQEQIKMVKQAAPELAATTNEQRNAALAAVRTALLQHQEEIFEANRQDMEQAEADGVSGPVRKRLKFDEGKLRDVMAGISICRNPDLANVFYRLHLIEAYGTGISKIIGAYADVAEKPVIETTRNTFKIVLPNINVLCEKTDTPESEVKDEKNPETDEEDTQKLSDEEEKVLEYAENCEDFTKNDVVSLLKVSASTAARVIRGLVEKNFLKRNGKARSTYYTLQKY